jgi:hypothetical protein
MVSEKVLGSLGPAQHYSTKLLLPVLLLHLFNNAETGLKKWATGYGSGRIMGRLGDSGPAFCGDPKFMMV